MLQIQTSLENISERLLVGNLLAQFCPPPRLSTKDWAETNRWLTSEVSAIQGKMDCSRTPWMLYVMECFDNPLIRIITARKSAQIAWTETVNSFIGKTIDLDPRNIMIAFARAKSYQAYFKEKLKPYIENTPVLHNKIGSLKKVSHIHIPFPGGFIKLVTAGTIGDIKSSVISIIIIEEPDDVKEDVNKQGAGLDIIKQRMKTIEDGKLIFGGTPTYYGASQSDEAYKISNQMEYRVPCHKCGDFHTLDFNNLKCDTWQDRKIDDIYGIWNPETAYYLCPHCKTEWSFEEKNKNVKEAINFFRLGWEITKPEITDIYGFAFNELLSPFKTSSFIELAKTRAKAEKLYEQGKEGALKSWYNNNMGLAYQPPQLGIEVEELIKKRLDYEEGIIPYQGLILTAGIDVQRNRFAIVVRAWGRQNCSWLVKWTEIFGNTGDWEDPVWNKLTEFILSEWPHESGDNRKLKIEATTIDSGDQTQLVYRWVKYMNEVEGTTVYAGKGVDNEKFTDYDIFNEPANMENNSEVQERRSLASRMGVNLFLIGTHAAHSEIIRRVNLNGNTDRYYHCESAYPKYEEGILSCYKQVNNVWKQKPGIAKEVIDCEKMALHASHGIQIHNYEESDWKAREDYVYNLKRL